jgi:hypothetical protein
MHANIRRPRRDFVFGAAVVTLVIFTAIAGAARVSAQNSSGTSDSAI